MEFDLEDWAENGGNDLTKQLFGSDIKGPTKKKKRKGVTKVTEGAQTVIKKKAHTPNAAVSLSPGIVLSESDRAKAEMKISLEKKLSDSAIANVNLKDYHTDKGQRTKERDSNKGTEMKDRKKRNKYKDFGKEKVPDHGSKECVDFGSSKLRNQSNISVKASENDKEKMVSDKDKKEVYLKKSKKSSENKENGQNITNTVKAEDSEGSSNGKDNSKKATMRKKAKKSKVKSESVSSKPKLVPEEGVDNSKVSDSRNKRKRKKKKKPSSKRNKYKHLDEARRAAKAELGRGSDDNVLDILPVTSDLKGINALEKRKVQLDKLETSQNSTQQSDSGRQKKKNRKRKSQGTETCGGDGIAGKIIKLEKTEKESGNPKQKTGKIQRIEDFPRLEDSSGSTEEKRKRRKRKRITQQECSSSKLESHGKNENTETHSESATKRSFNLKRLHEILQNEKPNNSEKNSNSKDKTSVQKKNRGGDHQNLNREDAVVKENSPKGKVKQTLKERMTSQLKAARFRYLNEQLYTKTGDEALAMFTSDEDSFMVYHEGFQTQVAKWPTNPVDVIIQELKKCKPGIVIADFGCGDAKIARSVPTKVHSFDLVAINDHVTACDMAKVPLANNKVDIAVFCLSLMGTNLKDYLTEANRVLKKGGTLKVAEVTSRFSSVPRFLFTVEKFGFKLHSQDDSNKMFILFDFRKVGAPKTSAPDFQLEPCIYKRR